MSEKEKQPGNRKKAGKSRHIKRKKRSTKIDNQGSPGIEHLLFLGPAKSNRSKNRAYGISLGRKRDHDSIAGLVRLMEVEDYSSAAATALAACGEEAPSTIMPFADRFLAFLNAEQDWLVASSMEALTWICKYAPQVVWSRRDELIGAFNSGTLEIQHSAVKILASLADSSPKRRKLLSPMLLEILQQCGKRVLPDWTEILFPVLAGRAKAGAVRVLRLRMDELQGESRERIEQIIG
ncbi:MAG: hypothetical protein GXP49_05270 [Deltaproteobacteria bacterium]|nr:hypothetical protein [Deltaproteobacteria bacterium]